MLDEASISHNRKSLVALVQLPLDNLSVTSCLNLLLTNTFAGYQANFRQRQLVLCILHPGFWKWILRVKALSIIAYMSDKGPRLQHGAAHGVPPHPQQWLALHNSEYVSKLRESRIHLQGEPLSCCSTALPWRWRGPWLHKNSNHDVSERLEKQQEEMQEKPSPPTRKMCVSILWQVG